MAYLGQSLTEGTRRVYTYTATASQTTFSAVYGVGAVDVYQNGVLLAPTDYTATNGTTVVLTVGAAVNDEITIICHNTFSVSDTVSASQGGTFNAGIDVTGTVTADGLTVDGNPTFNNTGDALLNFTAFDGSQDATSQIMVTRQDVSTSKSRFRIYNNNGSGLVRALDITGDNDISFYEDTGTTAKFFWDASAESLGIGTTSPNDKLTISGSAAYMTIDRSDGEAGVTFRYNGDNTKRADIATQTNGDLRFRTNLAEAMRIDSSGQVGIGTTSPSAPLDVAGNNASGPVAEFRAVNASNEGYILIDSPTDSDLRPSFVRLARGGTNEWTVGGLYGDTSRGVHFYDHGSSSTRMIIQSGGNVGIGTSSPSSPLHVVGNSSGGFLGGGIRINDTNNSSDWFIGGAGSGKLQIAEAAGSTRMMIDTSGNVIATKSLQVGDSSITNQYGPSIGYVADFQASSGTQTYISISRPSVATLGDTGLVIGEDGSDSYITQRENKPIKIATNNLNRVVIDGSGRVTMPYQPAFLCRPPGNSTILAGEHIVTGTWSSDYNIGNHFNTSNGQFTAPVAGVYVFSWAIFASGSLGTRSDAWISVNGTQKLRTEIGSYNSGTTNRNQHVHGQLKLSANDIVRFGTYQVNNCTIYAAVTPWSYASGYLLG